MSTLDDPGWKQKLIATGSDGASVNLGKHRSVTALLKIEVPELIPVHCVNHRLELGALDAIKDRDAEMFSNIKTVLLLLHKHYRYSAKAMRELKLLAEAMEEKALRPANLEGTRWMPHLSRSLDVLLKAYKVFVNHFEDTAEGRKGTADVQGRAKNILKHLKSQKLLHYMYFLQDVLEILKDLSLQFQRDTCSIPDALEALETACLRLVALKQRPGTHLQEFLDGVTADGMFQGVQLTPCDLTDEQLNQKKSMLIEAIIDHITNRLSDLDTSPILKSMQVFFLGNLPGSEADLATYGEHEIDALCAYFTPVLTRLGCQIAQVGLTEWPAFKTHMFRHRNLTNEVLYNRLFTNETLKGRFQNILMLAEIILCIPTSSAICERGFSAMSRIKSDWRATLSPEMLNYLMAISISDVPIKSYNCERALASWYHSGQRQRRPQFAEDNIALP